jgi:hypothetical protein
MRSLAGSEVGHTDRSRHAVRLCPGFFESFEHPAERISLVASLHHPVGHGAPSTPPGTAIAAVTGVD